MKKILLATAPAVEYDLIGKPNGGDVNPYEGDIKDRGI